MKYSIDNIMEEAIQRKEIKGKFELVVNRLNNEAQSYKDKGYHVLFDFDETNPDCIKAYFPFIFTFCGAPDEDYDVPVEDENGIITGRSWHMFGKYNEISIKDFSFYIEVEIYEIIESFKKEKEQLNEDTIYSKMCEIISKALMSEPLS